MSSSNNEDEINIDSTPPEILREARNASDSLLPPKSKEKFSSAQSMNTPFWIEEEEASPSTSRLVKDKTVGSSKKKPARKEKKGCQKTKALTSKSPFASDSESDSDRPQQVTKSAPKQKRTNIVSDSEDESSRPLIRAASLKSCFTQRVANGYTFQSDPGRVGKYYFELRVYNTSAVEKLAHNERWKQAIVALKLSIDKDSVVWKALEHLVNTGKAEFQEIQPVLYSKPS